MVFIIKMLSLRDMSLDVSKMSIRQKVGSVLNRNSTNSLEAQRDQAIQNFFITLQKVYMYDSSS